MPKTPIGAFTRDGQTRQAYTAGEATSLRNAGWSPIVGEAAEPEPVAIPADVTVLSRDETPAALQPETKRARTRRKESK